METVNEMIKGIQEELNSHQDYKEGNNVYYLDVEPGVYGEFNDTLKVIKTKIRNIGFEYDGKKVITLEYGSARVSEDLFSNRLYFKEEELRIALNNYLNGLIYIEREAGIYKERYQYHLRPNTSVTLANSKSNFRKDEYILYLDSSKLHRKELNIKGVCYKGLDSGKYLMFSNDNVEKDIDNLKGYYGESEFSELVDDIIEKITNYRPEEEIAECLLKEDENNKLDLDNLLNNDEFIGKLLSSDKVIKHLANSILNRKEDNEVLNKLSTYVGKNLLSRL